MLRLWSTFYGPRALRTHLLRQKSKLRPSHSSAFSSRILPAISAVSAGRRKKNDVLEAETYDLAERRKWVVENIANSIADPTKTLFAVIYIQEKQYKVVQDDVIHVEHNIPLDVGDEIILEKVLMVGGTDFTLIGRPLLDPKHVLVKATVVEKTTTSPEVQYNFRIHSPAHPNWLSHELTVLRINQIYMNEAAMGES